jgi:hypothetical protein
VAIIQEDLLFYSIQENLSKDRSFFFLDNAGYFTIYGIRNSAPCGFA